MEKRRTPSLIIALLFLPLPLLAQQGEVKTLSIKSKALEGNLTGDPAEQRFAVYTPPGYASGTTRYPVIFLLHGIADSYETWLNTFKIPAMLDQLINTKKIAPVIVVFPNGGNRFLGSFYVNSPVTGRWGDFIADELRTMVDSQFRTLTAAKSRAVVGHSMGGFGAIEFGMNRPDVFSVVYAISPCCLDAVEDITSANFDAWTTALKFEKYENVDAELQKGNFYPAAIIGLMSALSPKPGATLNIDFPYRRVRGEIVRVHPAYENLLKRFPVHEVAEHRDNLLKLTLLGIDAGFDDQFAHIPPSVMSLSRALYESGVPHRLDVYTGDHREKVAERLEHLIFPMVSDALVR